MKNMMDKYAIAIPFVLIVLLLLQDIENPVSKALIAIMAGWLVGMCIFGLIYEIEEISMKNFFRRIKWAWQRLTRGWDDTVVWNLDIYLADMMPQWLEELKGYGCPNDVETQKEWDDILDEMIAGFAAARHIQEHQHRINQEEMIPYHHQFELGMDLIKKHFFSLWN